MPIHSHGGAKPKLTVEEIIVVFFALAGFTGSVVLYVFVTSPIIIISFLLATGVASLVYGFLGGLQRTTFAWGSLKMTGSLAALVGVAFLVHHYLDLESSVFVPAEGRYEWQWAGDGWIGHIDVEKNGTAKVEMTQYVTCNGKLEARPLLRESRDGKLELRRNGRQLSVDIPVQFINYDGCTYKGVAEETVLHGTLERKPAYAGQVEYRSKFGAPLGDMILVKDFISGVHTPVQVMHLAQ